MDLRICFSFLFIVLCFNLSDCFNFETRLPVIKRGGDGSYFGFSVAEHQDTTFDNLDISWLLVGAPLDQNKQPQTNQSGALWKCPITTLHTDCEQVVTDGKRDVANDILTPPGDDEVKNGQWLGVSVRSQGKGGKVMVCAHRYIKKSTDYRHGRGLCYALNSNLNLDETFEPCKGRPTDRAHEQYGYCQAGTSCLLVNDTALVGSPGPYTWRGTVFVFSVASDFLQRDKTIYLSPHTEQTSPVEKYSYLGMSVTAANFFGTGIAYAAGAPRSNGTGQVVIFTKRTSVIVMQEQMILSGDMYTSNFGYELCTADVNGDKLPDLIVGAPNYFDDKNQGGAIYIYMNHPKSCSLQCEPPIKITGQPESRFGISITNLGDINKDGFEDIAVGAPYENKGAIYIFLGSKNGTIPEPSQVIYGETYNLETFGYSLSGGLDLDNNGYPDLLTGAYESSAVVLFRTRPIIEIETTVEPESALRNIDPSVKGCPGHPDSKLACFTFKACVSVLAVLRDRILKLKAGSGLKLNCTLHADIGRKRFPRVFIGSEATKPHTVHRTINLIQDPDTEEYKHCHENTVFIKEDTKDIQNAVLMQLSYSLIQEEPEPPSSGSPLPKMDDYPILNQQQANKTFKATFLKDCGDNDICESQLQIDATLNLPESTKKSTGKTWNLVLGEYDEVVLNTTVHNLRESAYEAYLIVNHSPSLSYIAQQGNSASCSRVDEKQVVCALGNPLERDAGVNIGLRFETLSSIDEASEVYFKLLGNSTSTLVDSQGPITLTANIIRKAALTIKGTTKQEEVLYGGTVRGESEMKFKDEPGTRIRHTYEVANDGPWHVNSLEIRIDWPFQVANNKAQGKWLLYMDEEPTIDAEEGGVCSTEPGQVNPLHLKDRSNLYTEGNNTNLLLRRRRKRDLEMVVKKGKDNIVHMNCRNKTAKCFKFHCTVYKLYKGQSATVTVKSRLWNSTLVEDYPKVKSVQIASQARLYVSASVVDITTQPWETEAQVVTIARGGLPEQQASEGIPIWMILVSVVAGLLLLLICIVLLYKCGFFKRTRPDPTLSGNIEKHTVEDYHDY